MLACGEECSTGICQYLALQRWFSLFTHTLTEPKSPVFYRVYAFYGEDIFLPSAILSFLIVNALQESIFKDDECWYQGVAQRELKCLARWKEMQGSVTTAMEK